MALHRGPEELLGAFHSSVLAPTHPLRNISTNSLVLSTPSDLLTARQQQERLLVGGCVRALYEGDEEELSSSGLFPELIPLGADTHPTLFSSSSATIGGWVGRL